MRLQTIFNRKFAILATVAIVLLALPTISGAVADIITGSRQAASSSTATKERLHQAAKRKVTPKRHFSANGLLPVVDQEDITHSQRIIADNTLRALPSQCRDNLRTFYVNYEPNPKHRGLGGADTIIIAGLVPDHEFRALLIHECGHVVDLGGFRGTPSAGITEFFDGNEPIYANDPSIAFYRISWNSATQRKSTGSKADFVSGYAMTDPFEDFAESFAYYVLQRQQFAKLAKKNAVLGAKFAWFERYIGSMEIAAVGKHVRGAKEPWDVTKLPYTWTN